MTKEVLEILNILNTAGHEAYLVGGSVRDFCLGLAAQDYDITTSALPEETMEIFQKAGYGVIPTGLKHGTVTVRVHHQSYEITTYRKDGAYSDGRHPDSVSFVSNLREDLARRDFTVNAMAWHPDQGVVDYFGGQQDLKAGVLRCVGEPGKRFQEDALRIFRLIRFASQFGFAVDPKTEQAARANATLLRRIAPERIQVELMKLLQGDHVETVLLQYPDILAVWIPEILPCVGFHQNNRYHVYDVWGHTCKAVASCKNIPELRLAMLLHDIEKPACYTQDILPDGSVKGHFYGHATQSAKTANTILRRLRFDNETIHTVTTLIGVHCDPLTPNLKQIKRFLRKIGAPMLKLLIEHHRGDNLAQAPFVALERLPVWDEVEALVDQIIAEEQCFSLKDLAVNGSDLVALGIEKGPRIGVLLNQLLDDVISGKLPNDREALLKAITLSSPL